MSYLVPVFVQVEVQEILFQSRFQRVQSDRLKREYIVNCRRRQSRVDHLFESCVGGCSDRMPVYIKKDSTYSTSSQKEKIPRSVRRK